MGNCLRCLTSCFRSIFSKSQDDEETSPLLGRQRPTPVDTQVVRQKQSPSVDRRVTVGAGQPIGDREDTSRRSDKYHRIRERKEGENPILESHQRRFQEREEKLTELQKRSETIEGEADGFEKLSRQIRQKQQGHH